MLPALVEVPQILTYVCSAEGCSSEDSLSCQRRRDTRPTFLRSYTKTTYDNLCLSGAGTGDRARTP